MPFTASIIDRSFIGIPDKILKLSGAAYLRQLPVLTMPWNRIRIGLICAVTPNGTSNIPDTSFTLGICSGQQYPGSSFTTLNYLGVSLIGTQAVAATRLLTYNAAGPYYGATAGCFFKKEESVGTTSASTFSTALSLAPVTTGRYRRRTLIVLDITKGEGESGAVTMTLYGPSAALSQTTDYRPDDLQWALDSLATPTIRDQALTQLDTKATLNYSPLLGNIDTLEIYWSNTDFPLEISALGAVILAAPVYVSGGTDALLGTAIDTFDTYATGSVSATLLTDGSGWSTDGSITYANGLNNLAPQIYAQFVGTTNSPDEPFQQYLTGSVYSDVTVSLGSYWSSPASVASAQYNAGSLSFSGNFGPQVYTQYVGTTNSPYDPIDQYFQGSVYSGTTLNQGTFWTEAATVSGYTGLFNGSGEYNYTSILFGEQSGTLYGVYDSFQSYGTNSGSNSLTSVFTAGSFWGTAGTIYSNGYFFTYFGSTQSNFAALIGVQTLSGTAYNSYDTFEAYGTGAVVSGVTLVGGEFWAGAGSIY